MLSRPGEAIYNDANGAPEGNHFFQVVWLSDERREAYLKQLHELARERKPILARTPIVFEGDAPADLMRNSLLQQRLAAPGLARVAPLGPGWVGDAISIKDPTSALFRRQGGNHLLIVGQNDEAALGVMISTLLSLAAQFPPASSDTVRSGPASSCSTAPRKIIPMPGVLAKVGRGLAARRRRRRLARSAANPRRSRRRARSAARRPRPTVPSYSCSSTICRGSATSAAAKTTSASRNARKTPAPPTTSMRFCAKGPSWACT